LLDRIWAKTLFSSQEKGSIESKFDYGLLGMNNPLGWIEGLFFIFFWQDKGLKS